MYMNEPPSSPNHGEYCPGDLAQIHEQYGTMLLSAVPALVRKGFDVKLEDGTDLLHDFYLDALPGILDRYDPAFKFSTYLYGAFVLFVRDRIERNERWNRLLVPLDEAIAQNVPAEEPEWEPPLDAERRLAEAIKHLPAEPGLILKARLGGESVHCIAERLNTTRYLVRLTLAEALGRAAVAMRRGETIPVAYQALALRLWRDGARMTEVAEELGVTRREVKKRYRELLVALLPAVKALDEVRWLKTRRFLRSEPEERSEEGRAANE
jgi:DNA-directed RNA polymerase specialized sigma24 family protein